MSGNSSQRRKSARALVIPRMRAVTEDTECGTGVYWCNHLYDPVYPWVWVDFRFPSLKKPKGVYYAVAMRTLEYTRLNEIEEKCWDDNPLDVNFIEEKPFHFSISDADRSELSRHQAIIDANVATDVSIMRPSITLQHYGVGRIGVHCSVNTPYINDKVIREFIDHFRSLGEPDTDGYTWYGEEVQVEPRHLLTNEYGKRPV